MGPVVCAAAAAASAFAALRLKLFAFPLACSGKSSGFSTPYSTNIFCSLVGRGFLVLKDTSKIGGGLGATGNDLCSSWRKKLVS